MDVIYSQFIISGKITSEKMTTEVLTTEVSGNNNTLVYYYCDIHVTNSQIHIFDAEIKKIIIENHIETNTMKLFKWIVHTLLRVSFVRNNLTQKIVKITLKTYHRKQQSFK